MTSLLGYETRGRITRRFMEDRNLKFTEANLKSMEGTVLEYDLKMLFVKAGLIKTIQRKSSGSIFGK